MTDIEPPSGAQGLAWLRRYTWWFLVPYPFLVTALVAWQYLRSDMPAGELVAVLAAFILASVVSVRWFDTATRELIPGSISLGEWVAFVLSCVALAGSAAVAAPFEQPGFGWLLLPGGLATALVLRLPSRARWPTWAAMIIATGATAGGLAWTGFITPQAVAITIVAVVFVSSTLWIQWWCFNVALRLEQSRRVAGELAIAQERLRFAAELHDIQGHHLQVIAFKSELAARLGPSRAEESVALMRDVQQLARDALRDTRAVVSGYRTVTPHTEIGNATRVLTSAGIRATATIPDSGPNLDADMSRELGLLIRESTTNILRHANAGFAAFAVTQTDDHVAVHISNDGGQTRDESDKVGTGLRGLADRFERAGGRLAWNRDGDRFTVTAQLPRKDAMP